MLIGMVCSGIVASAYISFVIGSSHGVLVLIAREDLRTAAESVAILEYVKKAPARWVLPEPPITLAIVRTAATTRQFLTSNDSEDFLGLPIAISVIQIRKVCSRLPSSVEARGNEMNLLDSNQHSANIHYMEN